MNDTGTDFKHLQLLSRTQLLKLLDISKTTLKRWEEDGVAPQSVHLPAGMQRYRLVDIEEFMAKNADAPRRVVTAGRRFQKAPATEALLDAAANDA